MTGRGPRNGEDRIAEVLARIQLPLDNLEFAIDSYLQDNAGYLDERTRAMLISVRDNVHRIGRSTRVLAEPPAGSAAGDQRAAEKPLEMQTGI